MSNSPPLPPDENPEVDPQAAKRVQEADQSGPEPKEPPPTPRLPGPAATPRPKPVAVPHHVPPAVAPVGNAAAPPTASPRPYGTPPRVTPASAFAPPPQPSTLEEWADTIPVAPPEAPRLQLPPHRTKVERITEHLTGIVDDVKALAQLSGDYVQAQVATVQAKVHELQQRIEKAQFLLESSWLFAVLALCALLLLVLMLAFGMSAAMEALFFDGRYLLSLMLGFFSTAVLLVLIGLGHMFYKRSQLLKQKQARADLGEQHAKQHAHDA